MDLIESLRGLFQDFHAGSFIGISSILYILIQVLRGKAGIDIPWLTTAWNKIESKSVKTWIILGLFGLTGVFTALGSEEVSFLSVIDSLLAGLGVGLGTLGFRTAAKNTMESEGVQSFKDKMKDAIGKKDEDKS